jgi:hypothetical protein
MGGYAMPLDCSEVGGPCPGRQMILGWSLCKKTMSMAEGEPGVPTSEALIRVDTIHPLHILRHISKEGNDSSHGIVSALMYCKFDGYRQG